MVEKMKNQELITNKKPLNLQIKNGIKYFPVFVVLCVFAFLLLAPLVWMCLGSFKSDTEVMQYPPKFFPQANHLIENWKKVLTRIDFLTLTKNTVIYAVGCTIPSMFINALAWICICTILILKGKNVLFLLFFSNNYDSVSGNHGAVVFGSLLFKVAQYLLGSDYSEVHQHIGFSCAEQHFRSSLRSLRTQHVLTDLESLVFSGKSCFHS